jgi:hypothetical protein
MFMEDITDGTLDKMINGIPDDTDILITQSANHSDLVIYITKNTVAI